MNEKENTNESIVLVGGGGGVFRIARFLKHLRPNITTIQTTFDSGGHSGVLRDELGVLPPGDIRQAILALADETKEPVLRELMSYRFSKGGGSLDNAKVGNILLTALTEITGSLPNAINYLCGLFGVRGKVLPVSLEMSDLCVELDDGAIVCGEGAIDTRSHDDNRKIAKVYLRPQANMYPPACEAIVHADKIVLCPGDLYTSLVPNLLVDGFREAIQSSKAKIIFVTNLVSKKTETDGFTVADLSRVVSEYLGRKIDYVICNSEDMKAETRAKYATEKSHPVAFDERVKEYVEQVIQAPLMEDGGDVVRHRESIAHLIAQL